MILLEVRDFLAWPPPGLNAMIKVESPQKGGKIKEIDSYIEPPGRNEACHHLDFSLVDLCELLIYITVR